MTILLQIIWLFLPLQKPLNGTQIVPILLSKQCMWKEKIILVVITVQFIYFERTRTNFIESVPFPFVVAMTDETNPAL